MSKYFKATGLRWLLDAPVQSEWKTLEERLDAILDAHLWFLPIPRYSYVIDRYLPDPTTEQLIKAVKAAGGSPPANPEEAYEFYKSNYKHISVLRDSTLSIDVHVYILCLMLLDRVELNKTSRKIVHDANFISNARDIISDYFTPSEDMFDLCAQLDSYLLATKLPKHEEHWMRFKDIDPTVMGDLSTYVEKKIAEFSKTYTVDQLREAAYISSLVDEEPKIGFNL
jgi:hypothetical protein